MPFITNKIICHLSEEAVNYINKSTTNVILNILQSYDNLNADNKFEKLSITHILPFFPKNKNDNHKSSSSKSRHLLLKIFQFISNSSIGLLIPYKDFIMASETYVNYKKNIITNSNLVDAINLIIKANNLYSQKYNLLNFIQEVIDPIFDRNVNPDIFISAIKEIKTHYKDIISDNKMNDNFIKKIKYLLDKETQNILQKEIIEKKIKCNKKIKPANFSIDLRKIKSFKGDECQSEDSYNQNTSKNNSNESISDQSDAYTSTDEKALISYLEIKNQADIRKSLNKYVSSEESEGEVIFLNNNNQIEINKGNIVIKIFKLIQKLTIRFISFIKQKFKNIAFKILNIVNSILCFIMKLMRKFLIFFKIIN